MSLYDFTIEPEQLWCVLRIEQVFNPATDTVFGRRVRITVHQNGDLEFRDINEDDELIEADIQFNNIVRYQPYFDNEYIGYYAHPINNYSFSYGIRPETSQPSGHIQLTR